MTSSAGTPRQDITARLQAWGCGDETALDAPLPAVYGELRHQAERYMRRQPANHTLQSTGLEDALRRLAKFDSNKARLVELRYFAGLSIEESAQALGVSPATLERQWKTARAWLRRELSPLPG